MSTDQTLPHFLVGIDFGQTYTGVAWTNLHVNDRNPIRSIKDWPGLPYNSVETKVPTKILYPLDGREPRWGFLSNPDDEDYNIAQVREHFKIYLDENILNLALNTNVGDIPQTVDQARGLVTDYLRQIYQHTKHAIEAVTGSWQDKRVEFVFSIPTTWDSLDTVNRFKDAINDAGFSTGNHSATVELTEAEAAAVYMATHPQVVLTKNDIILVCDAGGGTTDLGLVKVIDPDHEKAALQQIAAVRGIGIGSTMIDRAFQLHVQGRLDEHADHNIPEDFATKVARGSSFQSIKHRYGIPAAEQPTYKISIDKLELGITPNLTHRGLGIEKGKMHFQRSEIQHLFDTQINLIVRYINRQLDWMSAHRSDDHVKFLFLSGGLGGSPYVNTRVQAYYQRNPHTNAPGLVILRSQEPQLAVVIGLVMDRRQKLLSGVATLRTRIARASYGVLCREIYNKNIHIGEEVMIDPFDKKLKWATQQIDWLIKKGDTIDTNTAIERAFTRRLYPGEDTRRWDLATVISHEDQKSLPTSLRKSGWSMLCQVQSNLEGVSQNEFQLKNRKLWQGKPYYIAAFTVKVIIGPADLKWELWFKNKRYNQEHGLIPLKWDIGASLRPPSSEGLPDLWELDVTNS